MPVGFYTNPPPAITALFSTIHGQRSPRKMEHILPKRRIHLWTRDEIQLVCNSLRKVFWEFMKNMSQPYCWDDLWGYFDAFDLYHYGAINLWNVINHLYDENRIIYKDMAKECAIQIGLWADDWIQKGENRAKLANWDGSKGPFFTLMTEDDLKSLGPIQDNVIPLIASALESRRTHMLADSSQSQKVPPNDLMTACRNNNMQNWLCESCHDEVGDYF